MQIVEETALIPCYSCQELRSDDELNQCTRCGERFCGIALCEARCACDGQRERAKLVMEIETLLHALEEGRPVG